MTYQVGPSERPDALGESSTPGVPGQWVEAAKTERLPLRFSDGSLIRLESAARARVLDVSNAGGRVALESGTLHAEIVHRDNTRWLVDAGPFEVRVTGTRFDVGWMPSHSAITVTLLEGSVAVTGCDLAVPRVIAAGETFHATCHDDSQDGAEKAGTLARSDSGADAGPLPGIVPSATRAAPAGPPRLPAGVATADARDRDAWRTALSVGRYGEAIDLVESEGLSSVCASADIGALMDLSDAARFVHRIERAKIILLEVRRRFSGDPRAATAAFNLGRIAFDDEAAFADAAQWFDRYVAELPGGPLSREASGRRIEALEMSGDHAGAVRAAKAYLDRFPTGPHSKLALAIESR